MEVLPIFFYGGKWPLLPISEAFSLDVNKDVYPTNDQLKEKQYLRSDTVRYHQGISRFQ